jgi:hypothetical protein
VLLIAWTVAAPFTVAAAAPLVCVSALSTPFQATLVALKALGTVYGAYLTHSVRHLPASFNESRHITLAIYNMSIVAAVYLVIAILVGSSLSDVALLRIEFGFKYIIVVCTALFIFVPKIHKIVWQEDGANAILLLARKRRDSALLESTAGAGGASSSSGGIAGRSSITRTDMLMQSTRSSSSTPPLSSSSPASFSPMTVADVQTDTITGTAGPGDTDGDCHTASASSFSHRAHRRRSQLTCELENVLESKMTELNRALLTLRREREGAASRVRRHQRDLETALETVDAVEEQLGIVAAEIEFLKSLGVLSHTHAQSPAPPHDSPAGEPSVSSSTASATVQFRRGGSQSVPGAGARQSADVELTVSPLFLSPPESSSSSGGDSNILFDDHAARSTNDDNARAGTAVAPASPAAIDSVEFAARPPSTSMPSSQSLSSAESPTLPALPVVSALPALPALPGLPALAPLTTASGMRLSQHFRSKTAVLPRTSLVSTTESADATSNTHAEAPLSVQLPASSTVSSPASAIQPNSTSADNDSTAPETAAAVAAPPRFAIARRPSLTPSADRPLSARGQESAAALKR